MIHRMFTIYDSKTEAYLRPFYCLTAGEAERTFGDTCNDPSTLFYRHPGDYTLFEIGTFDDATSVIVGDSPRNLGTALNFKKDDQDAP